MSHGTQRILSNLVRRAARRSLNTQSRRCNSTFNKREWSTPLAHTLANVIKTTGPVPIAAFMRQVLTSPDGGYYTSKPESGGEVFGRKGDFVTSPEISQVFGELVGIWTVAEWMAQGGKKSGVQLMEIGPGKGTLMDDMLRVCFSNSFFNGLLNLC